MVVTASSPVAPAAPAAWHTRRARLRAAGSCAALLLTAFAVGGCAGDGGTGHVAIGGVGPSPDSTAGSADTPPDGRVVMVPLDGSPPRGAPGTSAPPGTHAGGPPAAGNGPVPPGSGHSSTSAPPPVSKPGPAPSKPPGHPGSTGSTPGTPGTPGNPGTPPGGSGPTTPPAPAHLVVSVPLRTADADRWCEKVTVTFTNTGGRPVTAGTVTFGTHIIGGLGIDWATIDTAKPVPVPLAGGASRTASWDLCVDAWRVPLGMHIETRDATLS